MMPAHRQWNRSIALAPVVCELCGSNRARPVMTGPDRLLGVPGTFHVVQCEECGLVYTNPRPTEESLPHCYVGGYSVYSPTGGQAARMRFYHDRLARRLSSQSTRSGRRVLDLGCGDGLFLEAMRARGWEAVGLEMDAGAAARARDQRGLEVVTAALTDAHFDAGSFDLITMSHFLEHLPHPRQAIRQIRGWLRPAGTLFITLPNESSWERRLFGSRWYHWDLPRHLCHFDPGTLIRLLNEEGFEAQDLRFLTGLYVPQSIRYCVRRTPPALLQTARREPGAQSGSIGLPTAGAENRTSSGLREALKSAIYRTLLIFASTSGRVIRGEILELTALVSE